MVRASLWVVLLAVPAAATTYTVGPTGRMYTQLSQVNALNLMPGDVIEVDGNATYSAVRWTKSGTAAQPITIRGLGERHAARSRAARTPSRSRPTTRGRRASRSPAAPPLLLPPRRTTSRCATPSCTTARRRASSAPTPAPARSPWSTSRSTTAAAARRAPDLHGDRRGRTTRARVFRMQHCWVHDENGGNNVKSPRRAQRDLLQLDRGRALPRARADRPRPGRRRAGETMAREDSDVVGNVLVRKATPFYVVRIGGDGTGETPAATASSTTPSSRPADGARSSGCFDGARERRDAQQHHRPESGTGRQRDARRPDRVHVGQRVHIAGRTTG